MHRSTWKRFEDKMLMHICKWAWFWRERQTPRQTEREWERKALEEKKQLRELYQMHVCSFVVDSIEIMIKWMCVCCFIGRSELYGMHLSSHIYQIVVRRKMCANRRIFRLLFARTCVLICIKHMWFIVHHTVHWIHIFDTGKCPQDSAYKITNKNHSQCIANDKHSWIHMYISHRTLIGLFLSVSF